MLITSHSSYIIRFCSWKRKSCDLKTLLRGGIRFAVTQYALTDKMRASQLVTEIKAVIMNRGGSVARCGGWECAGRGWSQVNTAICITRPGPWLGFVTSAGKLRERSLAASLIIVEFITCAPKTRARLDSVQISALPPDVVMLSILNSWYR